MVIFSSFVRSARLDFHNINMQRQPDRQRGANGAQTRLWGERSRLKINKSQIYTRSEDKWNRKRSWTKVTRIIHPLISSANKSSGACNIGQLSAVMWRYVAIPTGDSATDKCVSNFSYGRFRGKFAEGRYRYVFCELCGRGEVALLPESGPVRGTGVLLIGKSLLCVCACLMVRWFGMWKFAVMCFFLCGKMKKMLGLNAFAFVWVIKFYDSFV